MVLVFVGCLCCCGWTRDVTSSLYVKNGTKNNLKMRLTRYFLIHVGVHHTGNDNDKDVEPPPDEKEENNHEPTEDELVFLSMVGSLKE